MNNNTLLLKIKIALTLLVTFTSLVSISAVNQTYALDCDINMTSEYPAPLPSQILCPFVRVFNLGLILVGAVLIMMIVMGAIKMATSLGDPKAYQGASLTWTYALIGTFVVLGSFALIFILNKTFGLGIALFEGDGASDGIFSKIQENWANFLDSAFIFEQN